MLYILQNSTLIDVHPFRYAKERDTTNLYRTPTKGENANDDED